VEILQEAASQLGTAEGSNSESTCSGVSRPEDIPNATIARYRCSKNGIGHSFAAFCGGNIGAPAAHRNLVAKWCLRFAAAECGKPAMIHPLSVSGANNSRERHFESPILSQKTKQTGRFFAKVTLPI